MGLSPEQEKLLEGAAEELHADGFDLNPPVLYSSGVLFNIHEIDRAIVANVNEYGLRGEQLQKAVDFANYIRGLSFADARAVIAELPITKGHPLGTCLIIPRPEFVDE